MCNSRLRSTPVLLGEQKQLFGIETINVDSSLPYGVIILNAGLLHNVGPYRLHVDLAGYLSEMGFPVIRLDQSGKGESPQRPEMNQSDSILLDYDDAFAELERLGVLNTIIIGLCSGADDGLFTALNRNNVAGLVLLDGYSKKTWQYLYQHYAERLFAVAAWSRACRRLMKTRILPDREISASSGIDIRNWPGDAEMQKRYFSVLEKNTKIFTIFSGGLDYYNHVGQLAASLPPGCKIENLRERYFADVDHTYSIASNRDLIVKTVGDWVGGTFARQ